MNPGDVCGSSYGAEQSPLVGGEQDPLSTAVDATTDALGTRDRARRNALYTERLSGYDLTRPSLSVVDRLSDDRTSYQAALRRQFHQMLDAADRGGRVSVLGQQLEPASMIDGDQVPSSGGHEPPARVGRQSVDHDDVARRNRVHVDVARRRYDVVATSAVAYDRRRRSVAQYVVERRRTTVPDRQRLDGTSWCRDVWLAVDVRRRSEEELSNADPARRHHDHSKIRVYLCDYCVPYAQQWQGYSLCTRCAAVEPHGRSTDSLGP